MKKNLNEIINLLKTLNVRIKKEYEAEIVGVFGSYVRGEQKRKSDLDILVKFMDNATLLDFVGLADFLEEKLQIPVDVVPIDTVRKEIKSYILL